MRLGENWAFVPYEGFNFRTKLPYCAGCESQLADTVVFNNGRLYKSPKHVKKCSACQLVYYCSRECQMNDRANHKTPCNVIKKQRKLVHALEQQTKDVISGALVKDPESAIGYYWDVAFQYCKARYDLALLIHPSAYQTKIIHSWTEMNFHMQDLLRLTCYNEEHDFGLSSKFGYFLLHEGIARDDDAYSFCRYMMNKYYNTDIFYNATSKNPESRGGGVTVLPRNTKVGDWIYPKSFNCRYNDFFRECPSTMIDEEAVYYYVVIWLIKKRLLSMIVNRKMAFQEFVKTDQGQFLFLQNADVGYNILRYLIDYDLKTGVKGVNRTIEEQERQLAELSDRIDAVNDQIIPSFLDYESILSGEQPNFFGPNATPPTGMDQVYLILNDCHPHLDSIPGLYSWIQQRYNLPDVDVS